MRNTNVIMNDLMNHLVEKFGVVETEIFVSTLIHEPFDYTKWQRDYFDKKSLDELNKSAEMYCRNHPVV